MSEKHFDDNPLLQDLKSKISVDEKFRILFYGDSTASCEWVFPNWRSIIEYVLKMHLEDFTDTPNWSLSWRNLNFINASLNGATTQDFIERLERDVVSYSPDMIIYLG